MIGKLAWVALLALWLTTFQWMGDLEKRQRLTQDAVNVWAENQRSLKDVVNIQSQNQRLMIELLKRKS